MLFRCPVDDLTFTTKKIDDVPTLQGHPECPGPACQAEIAKGQDGAFANVLDQAAKVQPIHAPKPSTGAAALSNSSVSVLSAPPRGQGW